MNKLKYIKVVKKPWGRELWFAWTDDYLGKVIEINPGQEISLHKHVAKEETLWVSQGRCKVDIEGKDGRMWGRICVPGDKFHILPWRKHQMRAFTKVVLFEVSTPHPKDSIRLKDKYGRKCVDE